MNKIRTLVAAALIAGISLMILPSTTASAALGLSVSENVWNRCRTQPITWTMYTEGTNLSLSKERKLIESAFQQVTAASGGAYTFVFVTADKTRLRDAARTGTQAPADALVSIASDKYLSLPLGDDLGRFLVNSETAAGETELSFTSAFFSYNPRVLSSYTTQQRTAIYTSGALALIGVTRYEYTTALTNAEKKAVKSQATRSCSRSA